MSNSTNNKLNNPKRKLFACVAVLLAFALLAAAVCGYVYARYASRDSYSDNQISLDDFYFTVDILGDSVDETSSTKDINVFGGTETQDITFYVCNYFDSLRITNSDITYTVSYASSLTSGGAKDVGITDSNGAITSGDSFTLVKNGTQSSAAYTLSIGTYSNAETITVTIKSTSPYTKTLTLNFNLVTASTDAGCELTSGTNTSTSAYVELLIKSDIAFAIGEVTINWSSASTLQFDNTNAYFTLDTGNTSATSKKAIDAEESVTVKFFKLDSSIIYTVGAVLSTGSNNTLAITISPSV
ncbi:MAG: hypothetical protein LUD27_07190 [Clostridia bacterium]|nr:hypothetical protein [Clostridia bacterium]